LVTLQSVITHRYDVLAKYARYLSHLTQQEISHLSQHMTLPSGAESYAAIQRFLHREPEQLKAHELAAVGHVLDRSTALKTMYQMREELVSIWTRTNMTRDQLLAQLQEWCHRADQSDIAGLRRFSQHLRCYA
jgi:stearoyl-CoA desaturase (Delta-9 desaturase)